MPGDDKRSQLSPLKIKLNGSDLPTDEIFQVVDVTADQDLFLPSACTIRLRDVYDKPSQEEQGFARLLDKDRFKIGAGIEVLLGRESSPASVFKGEVTSIELEFEQDGSPLITVRGYDKSHRLRRERKTRTFTDVSDSDLASKIARDHGLSPKTSSTSVVHKHIFQDNQTDWEFLQARANRVGYELFVRDSDLHFRKPSASEEAAEQELGKTLHQLHVRMMASAQVEQVEVQGWDPGSKRQVAGQAKSATVKASIGESNTGAALAKRGFSKPGKFVVAEEPVTTANEAKALAQALYDEIAGDFLQVEGVCLGNPSIAPGKMLPIKGVSKRLDGKYYLSAVTHRLTHRDGYQTQFKVNGRRPTTLAGLLNGHGAGNRGELPNPHPGVVVGLVTNNKDPDNHGRVKVKFPWLSDKEESAWARVASPMAGASRGFYFLPEVNDEVLVAFEHGDINRPCVVGAVWNGKDSPPKPADQVIGGTGKVNERIIKSRLGHTIILDDSDQSPSITIVDKTGKNSIKIDAQTNAITVKSDANVTVEAKAQLVLKGAQVTIESSGPLKLKGAVGNIETSGPLTVKGAMIKLN
ncbi:MAG: VgrG-related protein [Chloroflexi bacterium]|nr:VgrG-related protein [Chloroflexota bacterium]